MCVGYVSEGTKLSVRAFLLFGVLIVEVRGVVCVLMLSVPVGCGHFVECCNFFALFFLLDVSGNGPL